MSIDLTKNGYSFEDLNEIIAILLGENGCPWDRAQTHKSLMECLLEECYEVIDAVNCEDKVAMCEELGDVLLQVVFNAKLSENNGGFDISAVIDGICKKMIRRHTHIFGGDRANNADEALITWEENKKAEKGYNSVTQSIVLIPKALPALVRTQKTMKKAQKAELDEYDLDKTIDSAVLLLKELKNSVEVEDEAIINEKYGQYLLESSKISAILKINAEFALTNALETYINKLKNIDPANND